MLMFRCLSEARRMVLALASFALVCSLAWGQANVGEISGQVSDATGAVVPGCAVSAIHTQTGLKRTVVTQENGHVVRERRKIPLFLAFALSALAQKDWPAYGHDPGGMRYSPLNQINTDQRAEAPPRLDLPYRRHGESIRDHADRRRQPDVLLDADQPHRRAGAGDRQGDLEYDPKSRAPAEHRGVSYWPGDRNDPAADCFGTGDGRLIALDAETGKPSPASATTADRSARRRRRQVPATPAMASLRRPRFTKIWSSSARARRKARRTGRAAIRARSTCARASWSGASTRCRNPASRATKRGVRTAGRTVPGRAVGIITVDTERGMVFLPTGNPADSFYGGDRKGTNLYANCVVALDAATGKLRWYYQLVHHDIFDYDVPGGPALIEVSANGRRIPAVAADHQDGASVHPGPR